MKQANTPFIKKFTSGGERYVYCANTAEVFEVEEIKYRIIDKITDFSRFENNPKLQKIAGLSRSKVKAAFEEIKKFHRQGYISLDRPGFADLFAGRKLEEAIKDDLGKITFVLTERCNLRCVYCPYTLAEKGKVGHSRKHSLKDMSWPTFLAAFKKFLAGTGKKKEAYIGFYGGEPLLNFSLMKRAVQYIKRLKPKFKVNYTITTNFTVVSEEFLDFLIKNDFNLTVSLDGPKEIQDYNRKYGSGGGTYQTVMDNLARLYRKDQKYFREKVGLNVTVIPPYPYQKIAGFFLDFPYPVSKIQINAASLVLPDYKKQGRQIRRNWQELFGDCLRAAKEHPDRVKFFVDHFFSSLRTINRWQPRRVRGKMRLQFGCSPGTILFVNVKGEINMCSQAETLLTGDVKNWQDIGRIKSYWAKHYEFLQKNCRYCWAQALCLMDFCFKDVVDAGGRGVNYENRKKACPTIRENTSRNLKLFVYMIKNYPQLIKKYF